MTTHAVLAPSAFARTIVCHGSVTLCTRALNSERTEEQLEGDVAHWVALLMVQGTQASTLVGVSHNNGVEVTEEMIEGGELYLRALESRPGYAETRVEIKRVHPTHCWGTPDYFTYEEAARTLHVFDYKFGHRYVEVFECWQLLLYAIGILSTLGLDPDTTAIRLVLVQPRCYHAEGPIRDWVFEARMLDRYAALAMTAAEAALGPAPTTQTGSHCLDCQARHDCTTLQRSTSSIVDFTGTADSVFQTPGDVGRELRILHMAFDRLKARITGKEEQAAAMIRQGKSVPFYSLESSPGRLAWTKTIAEIELLGVLMSKKLINPPKPVTPTQAIAAGIDASIIEGYASRPKGALRLVQDSTTKARKVFSP